MISNGSHTHTRRHDERHHTRESRRCCRVVIADHLQLFRIGLQSMLMGERDFEVVGEATNGDDVLSLCDAIGVDLLLLDASLPDSSVNDVLQELADKPVRTILLTSENAAPEIVDAIRAGASGVVHKNASREELLRAMRNVTSGKMWAGPEIMSCLVEGLAPQVSHLPAHQSALTPRELDIVRYVVAGAPNRVIARRFGLHEQTIKNHLSSIYGKLGVSSRLELAVHTLSNRHLKTRLKSGHALVGSVLD